VSVRDRPTDGMVPLGSGNGVFGQKMFQLGDVSGTPCNGSVNARRKFLLAAKG
jgi:hypothetical protein